MPGCGRASPSISVSTPAMILRSVDLPEPFRPRTPIFAPGKNEGNVFQYFTFWGNDFAHPVHGVNELCHGSLLVLVG